MRASSMPWRQSRTTSTRLVTIGLMRDGKDKNSPARWFWDEGSVNKTYGTASNLAFPRTDTQFNRFLSLNRKRIFSAQARSTSYGLGFSRFLFANIPTGFPSAWLILEPTRGKIASQFPGIPLSVLAARVSKWVVRGLNDDRGYGFKSVQYS